MLATDDHPIHIKKHAEILSDIGNRQNGENLQLVLDHIMAHYEQIKLGDPVLMGIIKTGRIPEGGLGPPPGAPPPGGPQKPPMGSGKPPGKPEAQDKPGKPPMNLAVADEAEKAVRRWGVGATASRLVTGTLPCHEELERRLASHKGYASAIVFGSGYMANVGTVPALLPF